MIKAGPWTLDRIVRMVLGLLLAASAWHDEQWWLLIVAVVLIFQSAQNLGCASGTCALPAEEPKPAEFKEPK